MKPHFKLFIILLTSSFSFNTIHSQVYIPAYGSIVAQCSSDNILNNLTEYQNLGVKSRGTAALSNTLTWLENKYLSYGYTSAQMFEDSYTYSGSSAVCKNLVLTKIGTVYPNTYVIVCGHYDSITGTGTNDNGSGVVSILEIARLLQNVQTDYSIKFINFSGEEDGLRGSQHFVDAIVNGTSPKMDIKLVFNIDEVGGVAGLTNNTITCERDTNGMPSTNNAVSSTMTNELITCVGLYSPLDTYLDYAYASDYMPFQSNNEIITGFFETNETSHKHTATDLLVYMDADYNFNVAKAATGATLHFAKASTTLANADFETDFQVSFFPNPTKDTLNVNIGKLTESNYTFKLIDLQGKKVLTKTIQQAKQIEPIAINEVTKGIYLAEIIAGNKRITKKIVIE